MSTGHPESKAKKEAGLHKVEYMTISAMTIATWAVVFRITGSVETAWPAAGGTLSASIFLSYQIHRICKAIQER